MKFKKPSSEATAKPKVKLSDKTKFKSKNVDASSVKVQKGSKVSVNLIKKGSLDQEIGGLVKNKILEKKTFKTQNKKQKQDKPVKLTPEVQLGLKLDKLLDKKAQKKQASSSDDTPVKTSPGKRSISEMSSQNEASPKKKRSRRSKKKRNAPNNGHNMNSAINTVQMEGASSSDSSPIKNKNKKGDRKRKSSESSGSSPNVDESTIDSEYILAPKEVLKAVTTVKKLLKNNSKTNKLLDSEPEPVFLKFKFYLPHNKQKTIRFNLPHSLVSDTSSICLFVADIAKRNVEKSISAWEEILKDEKVTNIAEVIPLKALLSEYSQYEDQRKLSCRFDHFMVDGKIAHRVFSILKKKYFHLTRKTPFPVKLDKGHMKTAIEKGLLKSVAHYTVLSDVFTIQVGHTEMTDMEIQSNILNVWNQYPKQFCVYWDNIKEAHLFIPENSELPIFCSIKPPEDGKPTVYKDMTWEKNSNEPVIGELSNEKDDNVLVYPSGKVLIQKKTRSKNEGSSSTKKQEKKLKKRQEKSEEDEEEDVNDESDQDDDLGGRRDMLLSDSDEELEFEESSSEEDTSPIKPKHQDKGNKVIAAFKVEKSEGKQVKKKKKVKDEDNSDIVDKAEEMYLKELAVLKKKSAKGNKAGKKMQKPKDSDEGSDDSHLESDEDLGNIEGPWMGEESADETETDKDIPKLMPAMKQNKFSKVKNIKSGKKINGSTVIETQLSKKKSKKKPAGGKNSPKNQPASKKQLKKPTPESQDKPKKKTSEISFQGVKADQKKAKTRKTMPSKNKKIAKKLSK